MTPDAERAESAVAHCRHTAGATYGADRGACAICIIAILAAVRDEATRAERERCAKIVENACRLAGTSKQSCDWTCHRDLAAALREGAKG